MDLLDQIFQYRKNSPINIGGQPLRWIEFMGGNCVPIQSWEPDATSWHDGDYYYNSKENVLYKRIIAPANACSKQTKYVWKRITERR